MAFSNDVAIGAGGATGIGLATTLGVDRGRLAGVAVRLPD